jgi:Recombination endonuclease VII
MNKTCCRCKEAKPAENFWKNASAKDGLQSKCKPCHKQATDKDVARNTKLLKIYGISAEEYENLAAGQNHECSICDQPETIVDARSGVVRRLAVDHDESHPQKHVRGLLCSKHNRGIGMFNHDIKLLRRAIAYLQAYQEALEEHNAA